MNFFASENVPDEPGKSYKLQSSSNRLEISISERIRTASFPDSDQEVVFSWTDDSNQNACFCDKTKSKLELIWSLVKNSRASEIFGLPVEIDTYWLGVSYDALGRPELMMNRRKGPSVSFSHLGSVTWAALCLTEGKVGIDAACVEEFPQNYPFGRVFNYDELSGACGITHGNVSEAAAILWTGKEAVVKCIGTGFHLMDPLELRIFSRSANSEENSFRVDFDKRILTRVPELLDHSIEILTFRKQKVVISVANMAEARSSCAMIAE